jgi:hypothetical protein
MGRTFIMILREYTNSLSLSFTVKARDEHGEISEGTSVSVSDELPSCVSPFPKRRAALPSPTNADDQDIRDFVTVAGSDSPELAESMTGLDAIATICRNLFFAVR